MKRISSIIFFVALIIIVLPVLAESSGPVYPTKEIVPYTTPQSKTIEELNLPYKPKDYGDEAQDIISEIEKEPLNEKVAKAKPEDKKTINWDELPYIPSKGPLLKPVGDPEL